MATQRKKVVDTPKVSTTRPKRTAKKKTPVAPTVETAINEVESLVKPEFQHLTVDDFNKVLPKEVAEKFAVTSHIGKRSSTRVLFHKYGLVDFKSITLKRAIQLVQQGAPFIEVKPETVENE